jgi:hypothetical protein
MYTVARVGSCCCNGHCNNKTALVDPAAHRCTECEKGVHVECGSNILATPFLSQRYGEGDWTAPNDLICYLCVVSGFTSEDVQEILPEAIHTKMCKTVSMMIID